MTQANILAASGSQGVAQGFKNRIINGAMVVSQRNGTSSATISNSTDTYYLDRYAAYTGTNANNTIQQVSTAPAGFVNSTLITIGTGASPAAGTPNYLYQNIEGYNSADLMWGTADAKTITLSFWVRSSLTGTFSGALSNNAVNRSYPFTYTISSANTWTQASVTIAGDTTGTWLTTNGVGIRVWFDLGSGSTYSGTAGAWIASDKRAATGSVQLVATSGATFYITGVQLEVGSSATGFEYRLYNQELLACQRYYQTWGGSSLYDVTGVGVVTGANNCELVLQYLTMRSTPTAAVSAVADWSVTDGGGGGACSAITFDLYSLRSFRINTASPTVTTGRGVYMRASGTTAARLTLSAEL